MIPVVVDDTLRRCCPAFCCGLIIAQVVNAPSDPGLWAEIEGRVAALQASLTIDQANQHPQIAATREAYKRCGKDPNRYRPSAEALRRRVAQGKGLYRVSTLVDVINLASLVTGYSIGAFDLAQVRGGLRWGIGREGEPYEGIGRGVLNIAGLPVLRDEAGAIGTPTSDAERTKLGLETRRLLVVVNAYAGAAGLDGAVAQVVAWLRQYATATDVETAVV